MNESMIRNLSHEELVSYTEELLLTGDYGPNIKLVLNKWLEIDNDGHNKNQLLNTIEGLRKKLSKIHDLSHDDIGEL